MKRRGVAILVSLLALASLVFAGSNGLPSLSMEQPQQRTTKSSTSAKKKRDYVNMKSDEGWQMVHNGQKIMVVVGHFAAYHNGTVITADSAVRYNERHIECFGNVLIKRGSTYIYGDRAEYDGRTNRARVYSKIIKVVDGDATLLTYNFIFNTKTNVGRYSGGGVLTSGDNMVESNRGYVFSDKNEIVCVDQVQMRNNDYEMMSDSVVYNTKTNHAQFFTRTNIWNKNKEKPEDGEDYLYADRGSFDKGTQLYTLTKNGYILTKEQELLCDTLYYYRDSNYVQLRSNVQIDDISQKMLVFGDWGEYWKEPGNVFVTKNPSLISYNTEQSDTVYMSSDSMFIYTRYPIREKIEKARQDSLERAAKAAAEAAAKGEKGTKETKDTKSSAGENDQEGAKGPKSAKGRRGNKGPRGGQQEGGAEMPDGAPGGLPRVPQGGPQGGRQMGPQGGSQMGPQRGQQEGPQDGSQENMPTRPPHAKREKSAATTQADAPVKDTTAVVTKSKSELRRQMIDSLASDTTKQGMKLRAKLLKEETAEVNKAVKEAARKQREEREAELAERNTLYKRLLGEAKVRDAERKRMADERAKFVKDSIKRAKALAKDSLQLDSLRRDTLRLDSLKIDTVKLDSLRVDTAKQTAKVDSLAKDTLRVDTLKSDTIKSDTIVKDSTAVNPLAKFDTMTVAQVKAHFKAIYDAEKAEENRIKQDSLDAKLERIGLARQAKRVEQYKKWERRDSIYQAKMREREYVRLGRKLARQERRGIYIQMADSATLALVDSILLAEFGPLDTLTNRQLDSLLDILYPKPIPSPTEIAKAEAENIDSLYREIRAYSHVKMFRSDFQSICDSLTMNTVDSIINMYKSPVMWNGANQITSEITRIISRGGSLERAEFEGKPMTASEIDTAHYNQVAGKQMIAYFRDNKMYRNDVNGNVQTIYYMQEEDSPEILLMAYVEAGDMTSYIENQQVTAITYRGNPVYTFYPIAKIPETQVTKLPNFKWEASRRPTMDSVFNRTIRPSLREEKEALSKPTFPINALMQQRKVNYLRRRIWRDRKDTLTYETIEWIESLRGY